MLCEYIHNLSGTIAICFAEKITVHHLLAPKLLQLSSVRQARTAHPEPTVLLGSDAQSLPRVTIQTSSVQALTSDSDLVWSLTGTSNNSDLSFGIDDEKNRQVRPLQAPLQNIIHRGT